LIYVLDITAWSDALRGAGQVGRKLSVVPMARVLLAAPVLYELRRGQAGAARAGELKAALDQLAANYPSAPFDAPAAEAAAAIAAARKAASRPIQHLDVLIAGVALSRGATLVTRDSDFSGIAGLAIESWA
jgi:predicted nucleic acid-binding protein